MQFETSCRPEVAADFNRAVALLHSFAFASAREGFQQVPETLTGPRCTNVAGFSLHANVAVRAADRAGLERLCRYVGRGPLAAERLSRRRDGHLAFRLKRPWSKGWRHIANPPNTPMANLLLAMLHKLGVEDEKFGDSNAVMEI